MEWWLILLFFGVALAVLLASSLPVAFCFMVINLIGVFIFWRGTAGLEQLILSMHAAVSTFVLLPVPLFVLMGVVLFHSGMGFKAIDVLDGWMGRLPGRLGLLAVASGTMFSTMSGSSMATTAMLGTLLVPEMEKRGYKKPMSIGPVIGSGGLAMIIPPSAMAVLLGSLANISIGKLLISGIIPGLLIALFYAAYIIGRCYLQPSIAPSYSFIPPPLLERMVSTARYVMPLGILIFLVIGLIFIGVATPSEAAAAGALGSLFLAAIYRRLNWNVAKNSILDAIRITIMVFMIITGSTAFSQLLAYTGASAGLVQFVAGLALPPVLLLMAMLAVVMVLGCFMDQYSIMMITFPIFMPIVELLGFPLVWFGLLMLINMEMANTTPPFGLLLFVMKGVAPPDTTMGDIYKAAIPFLICDAIVMGLVIIFPVLALWLPGLMR